MLNLAAYQRGLLDMELEEVQEDEDWPGKIIDQKDIEDGILYYVEWDPHPVTGKRYPIAAMTAQDTSPEMLQVWEKAKESRRQTAHAQTSGRAASPLSGAAREIKRKKRNKKHVKSEVPEEDASDVPADRKRRYDGAGAASSKRRKIDAVAAAARSAPTHVTELEESDDAEEPPSPDIDATTASRAVAAARSDLSDSDVAQGSHSREGDISHVADSQAVNEPQSISSGEPSSLGNEAPSNIRSLHPVAVPDPAVFLRHQEQMVAASPVHHHASSSPIETSSQMASQITRSPPPPPLRRSIPASHPIGDAHWAKSQPFASRRRVNNVSSAPGPSRLPHEEEAAPNENSSELETLRGKVSQLETLRDVAEAQLAQINLQLAQSHDLHAEKAGIWRQQEMQAEARIRDLETIVTRNAMQTAAAERKLKEAVDRSEAMSRDLVEAAAEQAREKERSTASATAFAALQSTLDAANASLAAVRQGEHALLERCANAEADSARWMGHYRAASSTAEERTQENRKLVSENARLSKALDVGLRQVQQHATASINAAKDEARLRTRQARLARESAVPLARQLEKEKLLVLQLSRRLDEIGAATMQAEGLPLIGHEALPPQTGLGVLSEGRQTVLDELDDDDDEHSAYESDDDASSRSLSEHSIARLASSSPNVDHARDELVKICAWRMARGECGAECEDTGTLISHIHLEHIF